MRPFPRRDLGPVLVTVVVAAVLLASAGTGEVPAYAVCCGVGGAVAGVAAAALLVTGAFEARLAAMLVSSVSGLLALLHLVLGAPGSPAEHVTPGAVVLVVCAVALPLLLVVRPQRPSSAAAGPYPRLP